MPGEVPWSREAEISVLGAALMEPAVVDELVDLPVEAFQLLHLARIHEQ